MLAEGPSSLISRLQQNRLRKPLWVETAAGVDPGQRKGLLLNITSAHVFTTDRTLPFLLLSCLSKLFALLKDQGLGILPFSSRDLSYLFDASTSSCDGNKSHSAAAH